MKFAASVCAMIVALLLATVSLQAQCVTCADAPPGIFFCDDFETSAPLTDRYFEVNTNGGEMVVQDDVGRGGGRGLRILWWENQVGAGGLSKSFGKIPGSYIAQHATRTDLSFTEIYWRMDVRHQPGWQGNGPAKLSRAMVFVNDNWAQGMMAHLWSGGSNNMYLLADPASGIDANGNVKSTKYNDFANLRWLGIGQGSTAMFSDANAGNWYCVVGHVKLNTPGLSDGVFEFWINDTLQHSSTNLNWHGDYNASPTSYTINAVFFENYWNEGSPAKQERYFDNLMIGTKPIPCGCAMPTSVDGEGNRVDRTQNDGTITRYFDILGQELQSEDAMNAAIHIEVTIGERGVVATRLVAR